MLGALRKAGLTANPAKCQWGAHTLTYLGYEVGVGKLSIPEARIKAIQDYRRPSMKTGPFLGTTGYYLRFVPDYARKDGALYHALRKAASNTLEWADNMGSAFTYLISSLCSCNILWLPCEGDNLELHTDASQRGIGAVLSVIQDGVERPIGYFSKRLLLGEANYAATELECLAVYMAIDHFAVHLVGGHFRVVTDHRALTSLLSSTKLNGRLMRWTLALQKYDFDIVHRAGMAHQNTDGLSRQEWGDDRNPEASTWSPRLWQWRGRCWSQAPTE